MASRYQRIIEAVGAVSGVQSVSLWDRVAGRERLYIDLTKHNGGARWNSGVGHRVIVHLTTGEVELDPRHQWAGAATREHHEDAGTVEAITAAVEAGRQEQMADLGD